MKKKDLWTFADVNHKMLKRKGALSGFREAATDEEFAPHQSFKDNRAIFQQLEGHHYVKRNKY